MKAKIKKMVALVLALILAFTLIAACANDPPAPATNGDAAGTVDDDSVDTDTNDTDTNEVATDDTATNGADEDLGLPVVHWHAGNWGWAEPIPERDLVRGEIARILGLDIQVTTIRVGSYDELIERLQTWAAAGMQGWPDIVWVGSDNITRDLYNRLGREGLLIDWMPHLQARPAVYEAFRILFPGVITPEGQLFGLPAQYSDIRVTRDTDGVYIRKDWIDQLGAEWPTNLNEFEALLHRFRDEIPDVDGQPIIPMMLFGEGVGTLWEFFYPHHKRSWGGGEMRWWFCEERQEAINVDIEYPEYLIQMLEWHNRIYHDGLVPRDAFVLTDGQIEEMASIGRIGAMAGPVWILGRYNISMAEIDPSWMFVMGKPMYMPGINTEPAPALTAALPYTLWAMRADAPEELVDNFLKFVEWSASPEGTFVINYGIEGYHWEFDENGFIVDTPDTAERLQGDWSLRVEEGIGWYGIQFDYEAWASVRADLDINSPTFAPFMRYGFENQGRVTLTGYSRNAADYVAAGEVEMTRGMGYTDRWREMVIRAVTGDAANIPAIVEEWRQTEIALGYEYIKAERTANARAIDLSFLPD